MAGPAAARPEAKMPTNGNHLILGEATRTIDARYRLSLPPELVEMLMRASSECILAKERPGCVSLWNAAVW